MQSDIAQCELGDKNRQNQLTRREVKAYLNGVLEIKPKVKAKKEVKAYLKGVLEIQPKVKAKKGSKGLRQWCP